MASITELSAALQEGRFFEGMFSPGAVIWQNFGGGRESDPSTLERAFSSVLDAVKSLAFEEVRTVANESAILVERVNVVTLRDGTVLRAPVCILASVSEGRITRLNEYLSESRMAPLMAALQQH